MQDVQNYQYYDPSPQPTPEPWWKRKRTWQVSGLTVLGLAVLSFAVIASLNALKNHKLARQDADVLSQAAALTSQLGSDCDAADSACLERARADAARTLGVVEACGDLTGEPFNACVTLIAQDKKDPEVCKELSGDAQRACADTAYLLAARTATDLSACDQILNSAAQGACYAQVKAAAIASGDCSSVGVEQSVCDDAAAVKVAIASGDPAACSSLVSEAQRYDCEQGIASVDNDGDGLVIAEEFSLGLSDSIPDADADGLRDGDEVHLYQTNPAISDTDRDGFSDGTEVNSGYDPLK